MILSPTRNQSSVNGEDHTGRMILELTRAMVASGFWRRVHQGDGLAAYSSGTADLFTAHSGLGYLTSGTWHTGGANSITNARAYIVVEEVVGGVATGRQFLLQRSSTTSVSGDRSLIIAFAWTPFTGSPDFDTAPSAPALCKVFGTLGINSVGSNVWLHLATSPHMEGAGGTIVLNYWVCDEPSGTTGDVCPFGVEAYDDTANEPAFGIFYDALVDASSADDHPCVIAIPNANASTTWEFGESATELPRTHHNAASSQTLYSVNYDVTGAVECAIHRIGLPNTGQYPNSSPAIAVDIGGKRPLYPAGVWLDDVPVAGPYKGCLESIEMLFAGAALWPDTYHASVADPDEPARISLGHVTVPWEVGVPRTGLASTNRTDLRRVMPIGAAGAAPTLDDYDPNSGSVIDPDDVLTVTYSGDIAEVAVLATYTTGSSPHTETIYARGQDFAPHVVDDSVEGVLEISRDPGWPGALTLTVVLTDTAGQQTVSTATYTLSAYLPTVTA